MRKTLLLLTAAALLAPPAFAQAPANQLPAAQAPPVGPVGRASPATQGATTAQAFVENAARSDMYEIAAAKIALDRSHDGAVRRFARRMVKDHSATTRKLMANLPSGLTIPTNLDQSHKDMLSDLMNAAPGDFDHRYARQQVEAHEAALALLRDYARAGDNPVLKRLARNTVPMVQMHLALARKLPGARQ
jgi:putative membrane protein